MLKLYAVEKLFPGAMPETTYKPMGVMVVRATSPKDAVKIWRGYFSSAVEGGNNMKPYHVVEMNQFAKRGMLVYMNTAMSGPTAHAGKIIPQEAWWPC